MPLRTQVPPTRRQKTTNFGDALSLVGGQCLPICSYSAAQSGPASIYVECTELEVPPGLLGSADFRLVVNCDWGAGNASTVSAFDCTYRQRIPVVAGSIELSAWIAAFPYFNASGRTPIGSFFAGGLGAAGTGPLAASRLVTAKLRAFIAEGVDATKQLPTMWLTQQNMASGIYVVGQGRLATFKFWATDVSPPDNGGGASELYMQLFDKAALPAAGDVPFDSSPVQTGAFPEQQQKLLNEGQTRGFVQGFSWGLSTAPFVFAAVSGSQVAFTTAEFET
jgi:hypothetical protein